MVVSENRLSETNTAFTQKTLLAAKRFSDLRVVGQIFATYLVAESEAGLVVIDQHAAHERVMYEKIRRRGAKKFSTQPLLLPLSLSLPYAEVMMVEEHRKDFAELGIEIDVFGEDSVIIRALPDFLSQTNINALMKDILNEFLSMGKTFIPENLFLSLAATLACHGSIRAGQRLNHDEIVALLIELDDTEFGAHCPHGRPIVKSFPRDEIKRWFDRT
jgi:DNA mismatch repair protein MutL